MPARLRRFDPDEWRDETEPLNLNDLPGDPRPDDLAEARWRCAREGWCLRERGIGAMLAEQARWRR